MFPGFFVGTIFLFWLVRTVMWGHGDRYHGYRHRPWGNGWYGPGESLWGDFDGFEPSGRARDRRARDDEKRAQQAPPPSGHHGLDEAVGGFVRALRDRLRATPGQEKALDAAVAKLRDAIDDVQARMKEARNDIARSVRGDAFDDSAFDAAASRIEEALHAIRGAARGALVDVHDRLDERQRATLSDLIGSSRIDL